MRLRQPALLIILLTMPVPLVQALLSYPPDITEENTEAKQQEQKLHKLYYSIPILSALGFKLLHEYCNAGLAPGQKRNDTCSPMLNALISTAGTHYITLSSDKTWWERVISDEPADNLLEQILPFISWGYAAYEFHDSIVQGSLQFLLHSSGMLFAISLLSWYEKQHLFNASLLVEASQIFYNLRRVHKGFMYPFAALFFIYRWGIIPHIWWQFTQNVYLKGVHYPHEKILTPLFFGGGLMFHGLNGYWGAKILNILLTEGIKQKP